MTISTPVALGSAGALNGSPVVVTTLADIHAGDTIVVFTCERNNVTDTVSDSGGNSYTAGSKLSATAGKVRPWWAVAGADMAAGSTITGAFAGNTGAVAVAAMAVSGLTGLDMQGAGTSGSGTAPSVSTGTLSQADELVLGFIDVVSGNNESCAMPSGFTEGQGVAQGNIRLHTAWQIVSATASVTFNPTLGVSRAYAANVLAFKG